MADPSSSTAVVNTPRPPADSPVVFVPKLYIFYHRPNPTNQSSNSKKLNTYLTMCPNHAPPTFHLAVDLPAPYNISCVVNRNEDPITDGHRPPQLYWILMDAIANGGEEIIFNVIMDNIYEINPDELEDDYGVNQEDEWFFFTLRGKEFENDSIINRVAGDGYWHLQTGDDKPIIAHANGEPIGVREAFKFYKGTHPSGNETSWVMHEFRLNQPVRYSMIKADWVLCRIYKDESQNCKKKKKKKIVCGNPRRSKRLQPLNNKESKIR